MKLRFLSAADVRHSVSMADAIAAVKEAYMQLSAGAALLPLRTPIAVEKQGAVTLFMPAYLSASDALGAKIVSVFPSNPSRGLPTIHALVIVVDANTGCPRAVMDGTYLTALRTGAASGVATALLARTDARTVAILGAGVQGRTQLQAVCTVRTVDRVWVYDALPEASLRFAREMASMGAPIPSSITVAQSAGEAVHDADVICTATTSRHPVFADSDLKTGAHINGVGSYTPEMQEIPAETVARARIVVDSRTASLAEAGDLIIPIRQGLLGESAVHGEIGQVAAGTLSGRQTYDEITFFKSVGLAIQDIAVARLVLARAEEAGLGTVLEI